MPEDHSFTSNRGRSRQPPQPTKPVVPAAGRVAHEIHMGLGDAVLRLIHVEQVYANIPDPGPQIVAERKLLVEAMNREFQLNLGMDCDANGIPDSIEDSVSVFAYLAKTSCCRITRALEPEVDATNKGRGFFTNFFKAKLG